MNLFGDWEDDYTDYERTGMFRYDDEYPDGHPKSAYKDDGDMKLFRDEDE